MEATEKRRVGRPSIKKFGKLDHTLTIKVNNEMFGKFKEKALKKGRPVNRIFNDFIHSQVTRKLSVTKRKSKSKTKSKTFFKKILSRM